jgi:FkbM family methyltransferase
VASLLAHSLAFPIAVDSSPGSDEQHGSVGVFSCVVDAAPRFHFQALRWYATLRKVVNVPGRDMRIHAVRGTDSHILQFLRSQGVVVEAIPAFDGATPYCNKISGAIHLAERGFDGLGVLTDTDVVILEDPRRLNIEAGSIGARMVGAPNPPLHVLENLFEGAGLAVPGVEPLDWEPDELTVSTHLNGGLYVIGADTLSTLSPSWSKWATWVMGHTALLGDFPGHIDQPAMALALSELGFSPHRLDIRWNFPCQNHMRIPTDIDRPAVIHYHKRGVHRGGLLRQSGIPIVDEQIKIANEAIAQVYNEVFPDHSTSDGLDDVNSIDIFGDDHQAQQVTMKQSLPTRIRNRIARTRKPRVVTVSTSFGPIRCWDGEPITDQLRTYGAHQRSDLAMVLSFIRAGDWVMDIGAHIGTFAVPIGKAVGPTGRVFAFEPVPDHVELLRENVRLNDLGDVVSPVHALVTQSHSALRVKRNPGKSGTTSFSPSDGEPFSGAQQIGLDSWWDGCDDQTRSIDLIKIDVEGMEYDVLRSGEHLVASQKPVVVFEFLDAPERSWTELHEFFADLGYDLFVNLSVRNGPDDVFKLVPLQGESHPTLPRPLVDVVAVPAGSDRHP